MVLQLIFKCHITHSLELRIRFYRLGASDVGGHRLTPTINALDGNLTPLPAGEGTTRQGLNLVSARIKKCNRTFAKERNGQDEDEDIENIFRKVHFLASLMACVVAAI
jgi:hypothetical protein